MTIYADNVIPQSNVDVLNTLLDRLRFAWSAETSAYQGWSVERPEAGQCAVTALLIQDIYGGELLRSTVNDESHYWNMIQGEEVDLTRSQFTNPIVVGEVVVRERDYLLSNPLTASRYETLKTEFNYVMS